MGESRKKPGVAFWATVMVVMGLAAAIGFNPEISDRTIVGVVGTAYAAFWIWLTVRIVNRRERWAIGVAASVVILTVSVIAYLLYLLAHSD